MGQDAPHRLGFARAGGENSAAVVLAAAMDAAAINAMKLEGGAFSTDAKVAVSERTPRSLGAYLRHWK